MQPFFLFAYVRVFPFSSLFVRLKQWRIHLFKLLGGEKKKLLQGPRDQRMCRTEHPAYKRTVVGYLARGKTG